MSRFINDYPDDWFKTAQAVKDAAGWECIRCGHAHHVASGHVLTVHHLDGDKSNCQWWNTLPLCQRCHLHIQAKVDPHNPYMWEHADWFKPYVAGFYAWKYHGQKIGRNEAMARMSELLAIEQLVPTPSTPTP